MHQESILFKHIGLIVADFFCKNQMFSLHMFCDIQCTCSLIADNENAEFNMSFSAFLTKDHQKKKFY